MRVSAGRREGRSHRQRGEACQDAFATAVLEGGQGLVAAVADGLGSRALSHVGSQVAAGAAVARLAALGADGGTEDAFVSAFEAARQAILDEAASRPADARSMATTLQLVRLGPDGVAAAMVGDGAVVSFDGAPRVLLAPAAGEYANEVIPVTHDGWRDHFRFAADGQAQGALTFTDGLTRLLLGRKDGAWAPFAPFFDAFLPHVRGAAFEEGLVPRFLAGATVDESWDDDKCLVVMVRDP